MTEPQAFWPGGARLAMSVSMQLEAGGQPISGAGGPITEPILDGFPDLGQNTFYEYGAREGAPRILDLMDTHGIKMTSFMIGDAVRAHPEVAAEIVRRGRRPPPADGHRPPRTHLRAPLPGPGAGPDLHPAARARRRVVGPQGPDRPVGSRPSRYRGLGRPRPGTSQRATRPQQLTTVTQARTRSPARTAPCT